VRENRVLFSKHEGAESPAWPKAKRAGCAAMREDSALSARPPPACLVSTSLAARTWRASASSEVGQLRNFSGYASPFLPWGREGAGGEMGDSANQTTGQNGTKICGLVRK
jgi:hypothetical protein